MSPPWQVLRTFRFLIILRTSFSFVFLKLKAQLSSLCLILITLGWYWNVLIAAKTGSWLLLILDALSWIFGICRSETIFAKKVLKILHNSYSSEIVLPSSFRKILLLFEFLFEKVGTTVIQNVLLSVTFLVSRLLKYSFLVVLKSFLQKLRCILYFFLSVKDLGFKYLFLNLDRFIISWCQFFIIKRVKRCNIRAIYRQQLFWSLRRHQHSSDQRKILKNQGTQTTARVASIVYCS